MTSVINPQNLIHQLLCEQQAVNIYHRQYFHIYGKLRKNYPYDCFAVRMYQSFAD